MRTSPVAVSSNLPVMIASLISAVIAIESVASINSNNNNNNNNIVMCAPSFPTPLMFSENVISTPNSSNENPSHQQHKQQQQQEQQHFRTVNNTAHELYGRDVHTYTASTIKATIAANGKNKSDILVNNKNVLDGKNDKAAVGAGNAFHDKINTSNQRMEFNGRSRHHRHFLPTSMNVTTKQQHTQGNTNISVESSLYESVELQETIPLYQPQQQQQHQEHHEHERQRRDLLSLHRQKRYLVFPESSSFQMIFDLIIPIVDWTNFAIMGITCAVAWELPSKPPSEIIENFRDKLNEGTFSYSRRNDSAQQDLQYVDTSDAAVTAATPKIQNLLTKTVDYRNPQRLTSSYYYSPRPHNYYEATVPHEYRNHFDQHQHWSLPSNANNADSDSEYRTDWRKKPFSKYYTAKHDFWYTNANKSQQSNKSHKSHEDDWWELNKERLVNNWRTQQQQWSKYDKDNNMVSADIRPQRMPIPIRPTERTGRSRKPLQAVPRHHIYPVFGKRRRKRHSVNNHPDFELTLQQIHLREQLRTRQKLYGKIEKLYKIRGHNGTACVLRALCETAQSTQQAQSLQRQRRQRHRQNWNGYGNWTWWQRQLHGEPQSFIMELLRAIFTLPIHNAHSSDHIATRYWQAHTYGGDGPRSDCVQRYARYCPHSIWQQ